MLQLPSAPRALQGPKEVRIVHQERMVLGPPVLVAQYIAAHLVQEDQEVVDLPAQALAAHDRSSAAVAVAVPTIVLDV